MRLFLIGFLAGFSLLLSLGGAHGTPQKSDPVLHPSVVSLGLRDSGFIHAWVFFKDKGLKKDEFPEAVSRAERRLTQRSRERRSKAIQGSIVTVRDFPVFQPYISQVVSSGAVLRNKSRWLNAISVSATADELTAISRLSFVSRIDPVLLYRKKVELVEQFPVRQKVRSATKDSLDYGLSGGQIRQMNCHLAHEAGYRGQGVIVLMLDTGYFLDHESIRADSVLAQWDFIDQDSITQNETSHDDSVGQHNHGTYTLSALGGFTPGEVIGPA
ncbi:MAG: hypothetical protein V3U24_00030, partial [Candidatus Neomarinimicrobiota bacterium]